MSDEVYNRVVGYHRDPSEIDNANIVGLAGGCKILLRVTRYALKKSIFLDLWFH